MHKSLGRPRFTYFAFCLGTIYLEFQRCNVLEEIDSFFETNYFDLPYLRSFRAKTLISVEYAILLPFLLKCSKYDKNRNFQKSSRMQTCHKARGNIL